MTHYKRYLKTNICLCIILVIMFFSSCSSQFLKDSQLRADRKLHADKVEIVFDKSSYKNEIYLLEYLKNKPFIAIPLIQKFFYLNSINKEQYDTLMDRSLYRAENFIGELLDKKEYLSVITHIQNIQMLYTVFKKKKKETMNELLRNTYALFIPYLLEKKNYPALLKYYDEMLQVFPDMKKNTALASQRKEALIFFNPFTPSGTMDSLLESTFVLDINNGITIRENSGGEISRSLGSAFFITSNGYALTNEHVIHTIVDPTYEGISNVSARLPIDDFQTRPVKVIAYDPLLDIALVKVIHKPKYAFPIKKNKVEVGDKIKAIGSPLGLTNTVTSGIISGKDRRILQVGGVLQIDASVNKGNSGGPLVDKDNTFVGIVFGKVNLDGFEGLNFVIPESIISVVLPKLFEGKKVFHTWLGLGVFETSDGLEVVYIDPNSKVNLSALRVGDIIVSINGKKTTNILSLQKEMLGDNFEKIYSLDIFRKEQRTLIDRSQNKGSTDTSNLEKDNRKEEKITSILVQGSQRKEQLFKIVNKASLYKIFPLLTGASIEVTKYSSFRPIYRITHVFVDSYADIAGFSTGDIVAIRKVRMTSKLIQIAITVIQQKRGFLTGGLILTFNVTPNNFI